MNSNKAGDEEIPKIDEKEIKNSIDLDKDDETAAVDDDLDFAAGDDEDEDLGMLEDDDDDDVTHDDKDQSPPGNQSSNPQTHIHSHTFCISIRVSDPKHFFLICLALN